MERKTLKNKTLGKCNSSYHRINFVNLEFLKGLVILLYVLKPKSTNPLLFSCFFLPLYIDLCNNKELFSCLFDGNKGKKASL